MPRQRPLGPHPEERPNWGSMNEGQRRYAIEQYQLARVRRGLDIDHPTPVTDNEPDPLPELQLTHTDFDSRPISQSDIDAAIEDINNYQGDNTGNSDELDTILAGNPDQDRFNSVYSELDTGMADLDVTSSTGGTKRAGDGPQGGGGKRSNAGGSSIPGRAGAENGGGGVSGASEGVVEIPRPINDDSFYTKHFKKQHKFFTFGFASKIISQPIAVSAGNYPAHTQYYMTSSLAQIPVHIPALYINQSEFNLLPIGSHIKQLKVTVVQRNPVLQFETNASATQLATLNQNKNAIYSIGLNKTGYGVDRHYTAFGTSGEPMIPTAQGPAIYGPSVTPAYQGLVSDLYGVTNSDANFGTITPKHQFGMYTTLKNYWCTTTTSLDNTGWPNVQSKTKEWDAANTVGMPICEYSYTPQMGLIKAPQRAIWTGLPFRTTNNYFRGTGQEGPEMLTRTVDGTGNNTTLTYVPQNKSATITPLTIFTPIEQGQFQSVGVGGNMNPKVQPSLHIGIMPAPALSSGSLTSDLSNSTFTDVRGYFDVTCEMIVGWREHTDRPFATAYNIAPGQEVFQATSAGQNQETSVWANAYGAAAIPNA